MANVLTKESLSVVRSLYRSRFVLVGSLVAIVCGAIALFALMPAYATVSAQDPAAVDPLSSISLPASTERDDVARARVLVEELGHVASSTVSALSVLEDVFGMRPAGVKISAVSYTRGDPGTIIVSGTAPSREEINTYRAALSGDSRFKSVSVPISTLTGFGGGNFSVTLTGTF